MEGQTPAHSLSLSLSHLQTPASLSTSLPTTVISMVCDAVDMVHSSSSNHRRRQNHPNAQQQPPPPPSYGVNLTTARMTTSRWEDLLNGAQAYPQPRSTHQRRQQLLTRAIAEGGSGSAMGTGGRVSWRPGALNHFMTHRSSSSNTASHHNVNSEQQGTGVTDRRSELRRRIIDRRLFLQRLIGHDPEDPNSTIAPSQQQQDDWGSTMMTSSGRRRHQQPHYTTSLGRRSRDSFEGEYVSDADDQPDSSSAHQFDGADDDDDDIPTHVFEGTSGSSSGLGSADSLNHTQQGAQPPSSRLRAGDHRMSSGSTTAATSSRGGRLLDTDSLWQQRGSTGPTLSVPLGSDFEVRSSAFRTLPRPSAVSNVESSFLSPRGPSTRNEDEISLDDDDDDDDDEVSTDETSLPPIVHVASSARSNRTSARRSEPLTFTSSAATSVTPRARNTDPLQSRLTDTSERLDRIFRRIAMFRDTMATEPPNYAPPQPPPALLEIPLTTSSNATEPMNPNGTPALHPMDSSMMGSDVHFRNAARMSMTTRYGGNHTNLSRGFTLRPGGTRAHANPISSGSDMNPSVDPNATPLSRSTRSVTPTDTHGTRDRPPTNAGGRRMIQLLVGGTDLNDPATPPNDTVDRPLC